jgi:hypothetical protein
MANGHLFEYLCAGSGQINSRYAVSRLLMAQPGEIGSYEGPMHILNMTVGLQW